MRLLDKREEGATGVAIDPAGIDDLEAAIVCAACRHPLTSGSSRIQVAGSHVHVFMNPAGMVFEIECFRDVPGARSVGPASDEWSWFPDHSWTVAICAACRAHVGWRFEPRVGDVAFHGLIRDRLAGS